MTFDEWYVDTEFNPMIYGALQAAWQAATLAEREECAKVCDELNEKVTRLSALLEAEPFRNERIKQLEQERDTLILAIADHVTARSDQAAALKLAR